ncbi:MAG TPA: EAL domain-containing protein [Clostridiaceae bacterium]|nr:EAL domain-containing protein [Clostridiaceae bacterium]
MKHRKHGKRIRQFDLFRAVEKHMPLRTALIIACVYTVLGICWIIFSDRLLALWANDKELYAFLSSIKGVIYVLASALLIFVMVFLALRVISEASNKLKKSFDELERTNKRLAESENFNKAIIDKMLDAYALHRIILDENGKPCDYEFVDVNPAFEKFTGIPREEIIGKRYSEEIESRVKEETDWVSIYGKVALTGEPAAFENYTAAFDKWVYVSAYSPKKNYFITIFNDITEIKKNEARLREYAYHDTLTGLPNRLALYEDFEKQITASPGKTAALFIIDSDNFKFINDSMGHSFGDILIKKMGERLTSIFKDQGSKIYRLGGDEFVLFTFYDRIDEVFRYAQEIERNFNEPIEIEENTVCITVSVGIATCPANGNSIDELIKNADIALYKAKDAGKNCYVLFSDEMHEKIKQRMLIEKHLRNAIENNELDLYYQPQVDATTGDITGFEALLRWHNRELGFVPPLSFISVAEETRLINPIGKWVLQKACSFLKKIHATGNEDVTVAVNVSIFQLLQDDFVDIVEETLYSEGIAPDCLELEITESILMESFNVISLILRKLKKLGVRIALDDFGKGYSSLSYLRQLPIDTLKIDKCFVDGILSDTESASLTGMIVKLGQNLGLTVIAEGVEEQKQMDFLKENGCHKIQGYLFSKPLPENDVLKFYNECKRA